MTTQQSKKASSLTPLPESALIEVCAICLHASCLSGLFPCGDRLRGTAKVMTRAVGWCRDFVGERWEHYTREFVAWGKERTR